jgi:hypothetical protein
MWRAGRKEFLSPENWVEPELRDDKTPSFPPDPPSRFRREPAEKSDTDT